MPFRFNPAMILLSIILLNFVKNPSELATGTTRIVCKPFRLPPNISVISWSPMTTASSFWNPMVDNAFLNDLRNGFRASQMKGVPRGSQNVFTPHSLLFETIVTCMPASFMDLIQSMIAGVASGRSHSTRVLSKSVIIPLIPFSFKTSGLI